MIDILLARQQYSREIIDKFLSSIFFCSPDRIKFFELEEFNSLTEELDDSEFDCLCVSSMVRGDASQLLQLYRYNIAGENIFHRIVDAARNNGVFCYIQNYSSGDWIYVGEGGSQEHVCQIDDDAENCFLFRPE